MNLRCSVSCVAAKQELGCCIEMEMDFRERSYYQLCGESTEVCLRDVSFQLLIQCNVISYSKLCKMSHEKITVRAWMTSQNDISLVFF